MKHVTILTWLSWFVFANACYYPRTHPSRAPVKFHVGVPGCSPASAQLGATTYKSSLRKLHPEGTARWMQLGCCRFMMWLWSESCSLEDDGQKKSSEFLNLFLVFVYEQEMTFQIK